MADDTNPGQHWWIVSVEKFDHQLGVGVARAQGSRTSEAEALLHIEEVRRDFLSRPSIRDESPEEAREREQASELFVYPTVMRREPEREEEFHIEPGLSMAMDIAVLKAKVDGPTSSGASDAISKEATPEAPAVSLNESFSNPIMDWERKRGDPEP